MTISDDVEPIARAFADPEARARLRLRHAAAARADVARVHPTWLARALREESPAVRATVAARGPAGLDRLLRADAPLVAPDRPPHPEILDWVLALWTERLVGGADRDDDPPVIVALTRLAPFAAFRLWRAVGLVKSALAGEADEPWVEERLGPPAPDVRAWAARDAEAARRAGATGRRALALLGLVSAFRLLPECEPFVMRRALQRLPYPIVRRVRTIAPPTARQVPAAVRLEGTILRAAWNRLYEEGRTDVLHPPEDPS